MLFGFSLDLQVEFLLTVPLCQSLLSSYKQNKMFSMSKLYTILFKYSLLPLQLYLEFIFSLSMNPMSFYYMLLSRFYSLWWHSHLNYRFGAQFHKLSRYFYPSMLSQSLRSLFRFFTGAAMYYYRFRILLNCRKDVWLHIVSLRTRKVSHNKFIFPIWYLPTFYIFNNRLSNKSSYFFYYRFFDFLSVDGIWKYIFSCLLHQFFDFCYKRLISRFTHCLREFHLMIRLLTTNQIC